MHTHAHTHMHTHSHAHTVHTRTQHTPTHIIVTGAVTDRSQNCHRWCCLCDPFPAPLNSDGHL